MYIHRIVLDANCINAKGRMDAMNDLEAYHKAGLIEILKTSTLDAEFRAAPLQKEKAKKYIMVGGSGPAFMGNDRNADAMPGAVSGESKFYKYYLEIFGSKLGEKFCRRSIRDCMHIDQAILNNANYFVTNEKLLIQAGLEAQSIQNKIKILTPENCLSELKAYFKNSCGTSDLYTLESKLKTHGPVIMGSNTCFGFRVIDPATKEVLLSSYVSEGNLIIEAKIRNEIGELIVEICEGKKMHFHSDGASAHCLGRGPLTLGDNSYIQIWIGKGDDIYLSARALSSGRVLFDSVNLHSSDGKRKLSVNRESMELKGLSLGAPKNAL